MSDQPTDETVPMRARRAIREHFDECKDTAACPEGCAMTAIVQAGLVVSDARQSRTAEAVMQPLVQLWLDQIDARGYQSGTEAENMVIDLSGALADARLLAPAEAST